VESLLVTRKDTRVPRVWERLARGRSPVFSKVKDAKLYKEGSAAGTPLLCLLPFQVWGTQSLKKKKKRKKLK
jgi:hypothetical protein